LPTTFQIETKAKELQAYNNYRFNDDDIDYIINEKKRFSQKSDKVAEKKIELLKEKEEAEQLGELDRVREIVGLIEELNTKQTEENERRNGRFKYMAYGFKFCLKKFLTYFKKLNDLIFKSAINQRNREESNKRVEDAMKNDKAREKETGDDPFKRRKGFLDVSEALKKKTKPSAEQALLEETKAAEEKAKKEQEKLASSKPIKKSESAVFYEDLLAPVSKEPIATVKAAELPTSYDVVLATSMTKNLNKPKENTENDLFMAHNFDININLTVPSFNTPGKGIKVI